MPRKARVIVPGMPHHIVQRGHNRNVVFVEDADYQYYLDNLAEWKNALGLKVYSYCLMTNHVHLIVEAGDCVGAIGELMKRLAGRQTRWVNKLERRTGSLWESRYKVSPIDTDEYLLQCCRYVELNPVKAGMVAQPQDYRWSSYRAWVNEEACVWLDVPPTIDVFGGERSEQIAGYKTYVMDNMAAEKSRRFIASAVERNQLTGSLRFVEEVERRVGRRVEFRGPGRPKAKEVMR